MSHRIVARPDEQEQRAGREQIKCSQVQVWSVSRPFQQHQNTHREARRAGYNMESKRASCCAGPASFRFGSILRMAACIRRAYLLPMHSISDQHLRMHTLRYDR